MMRLLMILVVLLMVGVAMPGCAEEGASAAADFDVPEGQRSKDQEPRDPPGPPSDTGFTTGQTTETPPPDDDSDDSDD